MESPWHAVDGPAGALAVHVAGADPAQVLADHGAAPAAGGAGPVAGAAGRCLVVCHGLPVEAGAAARTGRTFPALADRLAAESGWCVVTCCLRGVGPSGGDFSLVGWAEDLGAVVTRVAATIRGGVWLAGFGTGGSVALYVAATDQRVRGVATLGAPAGFARWAAEPEAAVASARRLGVIRDPAFPADPARWVAAERVDPVEAAAALAGRPLLAVHGADDDLVPAADARALVAAAARSAGAGSVPELRLLAGSGHRLRADPRAIALLLGWLERQGP